MAPERFGTGRVKRLGLVQQHDIIQRLPILAVVEPPKDIGAIIEHREIDRREHVPTNRRRDARGLTITICPKRQKPMGRVVSQHGFLCACVDAVEAKLQRFYRKFNVCYHLPPENAGVRAPILTLSLEVQSLAEKAGVRAPIFTLSLADQSLAEKAGCGRRS